jgi:hypothetical protein
MITMHGGIWKREESLFLQLGPMVTPDAAQYIVEFFLATVSCLTHICTESNPHSAWSKPSSRLDSWGERSGGRRVVL